MSKLPAEFQREERDIKSVESEYESHYMRASTTLHPKQVRIM